MHTAPVEGEENAPVASVVDRIDDMITSYTTKKDLAMNDDSRVVEVGTHMHIYRHICMHTFIR